MYSIVEQMNKTFLRLNESLLKSGLLQLNGALAQEVKAVAETFSSLAKTASEGQIDGDEEHGEPGHNVVNESIPVPSASPKADVQDIGWGYSTVASSKVSKYYGVIASSCRWPFVCSLFRY